MKQFFSAGVLSAAAGLVVAMGQYPIGALAFIVVLLILSLAPPTKGK